MTSPVICLGPRERVQSLVKLLRETEHNAFPVVHPDTKEFMGLVRRDQLVALLEFGVFDDCDPDQSCDSGSSTPSNWTPKPGVGKSPLMHLAYRKCRSRTISQYRTIPYTFSHVTLDLQISRMTGTNTWMTQRLRPTSRKKTMMTMMSMHGGTRYEMLWLSTKK